ncbi:hypothetical protein [Mycobacterium sp.]|uniref:DUF7937 domain-containing protein n=1 Tax=Mycobacterium sp. TaxID=1785 RepID=UPI0025F1D180|nr:hypothetical protein [Mycobacterium sp.]
MTAAALLVVALLLPWNLSFGFGIAGSNKIVLALLFAVTLLSLISIGIAGSWRSSSGRFPAERGARIRLALNAPYLLLVLAFVAFDVIETVRFGGTVNLPGGVGPGAWWGVAGSLLSVRSGSGTDDSAQEGARLIRVIGYASIVGAVLSFVFNLFWRLRYALQGDFGKQNAAVIATALVYGVVALSAVLVGSRWLLRSATASRLATVALGVSTLFAGMIVWILPVGRDIDAFHGIAQNTSIAGVGFEGYLAWAAAAAILAPATFAALLGRRDAAATEENAWRAAARNGLLLIAVWCLGSMAMRITDLAVAVMLNYPYSRYDSMVLAAFDLATAVLAIWLRINLVHDSVSARLVSSLCGLVAALSISRVVVGVALAPRFLQPPGMEPNPVYGNNLAQQITSTFDVALCALAVCILAAAIILGELGGRRRRRHTARAAHKRGDPTRAQQRPEAATTRIPAVRTPPPSAAATTRIPAGGARAAAQSPTTAMPQAAGRPRIFRRSDDHDSATQQLPIQKPRIYRPQQDSTP